MSNIERALQIVWGTRPNPLGPPTESWTMDERISALEHRGIIAPPFTDAERALARAASEANYFTYHLKEMPAAFTAWDLDFGIAHVLHFRAEGMSFAETAASKREPSHQGTSQGV
jgi:hypothetical protein